eukprot:CAMPEP_0183707070 /NCGR_PEP_ID=MMETSP0737-20130205/3741_1 /TAXON_ID=385413 /ORGANISM="Thalassiosira miniscula, Strain CCMP1093" /LENGTH=735 /DNA_ID=CAMNT_0025934645 /DNA_START=151 /DNA_END=2358 /DNA_ORIENTATION=+
MAAGGADVEKKAPAKDFIAVDPLLIRNVALVGHSHSGKTALAEWMLFDENVLTKRPQAGESILDFDPAESARHSSVFSHFLRVQHAGYLLEVTDTPWGDFQSDAAAATNGCDSAVIVASASDEVQAGTVSSFNYCKKNGIKCILALSKLDRPFLNGDIMKDFESSLGTKPVPLQVVIKDGDEFKGVQPLFTLKPNGDVEKNDAEGNEGAWMELEEAVSMTDDDLLMEYLDEGSLSPDKVFDGLRSAIRQNKILPLVYTSAEQDAGVMELMDTIAAFLPDPVQAREDALQAACESEEGKCGMEPGIEAGFAARVIHTTVDSFGSLSILRVISNSCDDKGTFDSIPHNVVNLRNGESFKVGQSAFMLQGKERMGLPSNAQVLPGNIIAVPKLPDSVQTNDILTVPQAVSEEESEILIEEVVNVLTPLSRAPMETPLMFTALVSIPEASGKKGGKKGGNSGDDKLISALAAISREDTAVALEQNKGALLLHCMSADHAQLVASRLEDRYGIEVELGTPPVQYKETISKPIGKVEGRHKKQSGGSGQFGVCVIDIEPLEEGAGVEFESRIKGGVISKPFISSVEKGVREQLEAGGPLAGYPVTDVRVILTDGKMHSVDSNDFAFTSAGKLAIKNALSQSGTRLLQPMEQVNFSVEEKMQGEISSIVSRNDGYVTGTSGEDHLAEIEAYLPTANLPEVSTQLRAKTGGSGTFTSEFSHYQPVMDEHTVKTVVDGSPHRHE